ncbi:hypothetical protein VKT23_018300 [Stygiomarasmius scandens]|uniref:UDP-Glycosyltransferase/glycogen phosphorylase n=1 Tax=Marasmiellus scandens TaxID=2682957 RepID=A0ABR1IQY5_9AGAR
MIPVPTFTGAFEALWKGKPIKCLSSGQEYRLTRPCVAVVDPFAAYAIETIRDTTLPYPGGPLHMVAWMTTPAGACIRLFGPKEMGGTGLSGRLSMKTARYGTEEEVMPLIASFTPEHTGEAVSIPGVPTMYDYEYYPQEAAISASIFEEIGKIYLSQLEGAFFVTTSPYEQDALDTVRQWLGEGNIYPIGPLSWRKDETAPEVAAGDEALTIAATTFLDKMKESHGEKSVVFISFGTVFWPVEEDKIWAAIEEFLVNNVPVIFAHPSPFKKPISGEELRIFRDSPIAMELQWAPQETILMHPATGWFISHGGWNSTQEAFLYRVPQIFWPYAADQPYNAALVSQVHKAGFELINIRTGQHGTRSPYRSRDLPESEQPTFTVDAVKKEIRELVVKLKGDEGLAVRKNYERLGEAISKSWDKDGEARKTMERFLKKYID